MHSEVNMYSYESFDEQTKVFLNKAMDIYNIIKDAKIDKIVKTIIGKSNYNFTKLDKKVLSLYLAAFIVDINLKKILENYDDISAEKIYNYLNINSFDIKPMKENEYSEFYEENFAADLSVMLKEKSKYYNINKITPELIFTFFESSSITGTDIIDYFFKENNISSSIFIWEHPSFKAIEAYVEEKGVFNKKDFSNNNSDRANMLSSIFGLPVKRRNFGADIKPEEKVEEKVTKSEPKFDLSDERIWGVLDDVQKKFIGQEVAAEHLFYNIVNNQQMASKENVRDGERSIIFLDGPTGTGKTAITKEITSKLDIPFTSTSATNYSSTGYVGGNITDTLKELYEKAGGDLEKAQRGIVVFDEFDKLAYSRSGGGLEMKRAVQQQLLDFMGGGKYTIHVGNGFFDSRTVEFDTSRLTFICLGALSDLRASKMEKKTQLGFESSYDESDTSEYSITPQDLMGIGLERELVGRFNTYLHTEEYSKEELLKILKESTISPIIGFKEWVESNGKKLEIEEGVYEAIVDASYELNTGARSLQTVMNNIRTHYMRDVLRGDEEVIYLDVETVQKVNSSTINRKGRK